MSPSDGSTYSLADCMCRTTVGSYTSPKSRQTSSAIAIICEPGSKFLLCAVDCLQAGRWNEVPTTLLLLRGALASHRLVTFSGKSHRSGTMRALGSGAAGC